MFKTYNFIAAFGERTGYQIHASRFGAAFDEVFRAKAKESDSGHVNISLLDSVSASQAATFPERPSILYNIWESTSQPQGFLDNLKNYDMLWVGSEAQRGWSISDGIPEEFVKVVPEGVDPEIYKPHDTECPGFSSAEIDNRKTFVFVHVGQWQHRKSTKEIIESFLKAFPAETMQNVRLELSVDTLFPSDTYKSTEERLAAYGFNDPRISVIHFEERSEYVRRLQSAHCFVSCSRSEGWGLPIIEAAAVGVPTIVADWGGSTEYATDLINVRIKELKKPEGIYGNWDVPGLWAEPDYDDLVFKMVDVYENYSFHKEKALKAGEVIRTKFSWKTAAEKAYKVLEELYQRTERITPTVCTKTTNTEDDIVSYARARGFKIQNIVKEKEIFVIGCWPNSQDKLETLIETITQLRDYGSPILVSTHYSLPAPIAELVDYVIYEKNNVLSGEWTAEYFRTNTNGIERKKSNIPYHGVACLNAMRNAVDFCRNKFDRMFYLEYDSEVDYDVIVKASRETIKSMTCIDYEGKSIRTDVWSGELSFLDKVIPVVSSWEDYTKDMKDINTEYILEDYLYKHIGSENINIIKLEVNNRFDQVDYNVWDDDVFAVNYVDGPYLHISGISKREYDVRYDVDGKNVYAVKQKVGMWSKAAPKYFLPWTISASIDGIEKFKHKIDLTDKRVLVSLGSKALGDTLAWMPYIEKFRWENSCHVICSGWWQEIFDYPEIEFVKPGSVVENIYAQYTVGCFDDQFDKNPTNWRDVPLQQVAADILGVSYEPLKVIFKPSTEIQRRRKKYICFSEFSTMRNKLWNREGAWQKVIDYCNSLGYDCISVSAEPTALNNVISHNGQSIQKTIEDISGCEFYIGLNHGPAWIAYNLDKPCIMISGVSQKWNDFPNKHRIAINESVCGVGCFNDKTLPISRDWEWCPRNKDYACTKEITEDMVIEKINKIWEDGHGRRNRNARIG